MQARGDHTRAGEAYRATLAAQIAAQGEAHPESLETAWRLGALLGTHGTPATDAAEAVRLLRRTARLQRDQLGEAHPHTLRTLLRLGEALITQARVAAAAHRSSRDCVGGAGGDSLDAPGGDPQLAAETPPSTTEPTVCFAEASALFRKCEAALGAVLEPEHPELVRARSLVAQLSTPDTVSELQLGEAIRI